ncbi:MAG: hypothetical protein VX252_05360 [Myxococcota bacterium]|nr:hypothetical protein [Myxococcota bacterium]
MRLTRVAIRTALCVLALSAALPVQALVLDAMQSDGNTRPPQPDPGWDHVIQHLGGPSAVYLGCRWVLTTQHVGVTILTVEDERLNPVPETIEKIKNPDGRPSDLLLFQVDRDPNLPPLRIPARSARVGQEATLIGFGSSRGSSLTVDFPKRGLLDGFNWQKDQTKRWGTNRFSAAPKFVDVGKADGRTLALPLVYDPLEDMETTRHEAAAAFGDSGGAVFADLDPVFPERGTALFGLIFSVSSFGSQPKNSSFYGNVTWAADLSYYRDAIVEAIEGRPLEADELEEAWQPTCTPVLTTAEPAPTSRYLLVIALATAFVAVFLAAIWRGRAEKTGR